MKMRSRHSRSTLLISTTTTENYTQVIQVSPNANAAREIPQQASDGGKKKGEEEEEAQTNKNKNNHTHTQKKKKKKKKKNVDWVECTAQHHAIMLCFLQKTSFFTSMHTTFCGSSKLHKLTVHRRSLFSR